MVLGLILFVGCLVIVGIVFVVLLCLLALVGWKSYVSRRRTVCNVKFGWEEPVLVGHPVNFRISATDINTKHRGDKQISSIPVEQTGKDLLKSIYIDIRQALAYHASSHPGKVEFVTEIDKSSGEIIVTFSVRNSGLYLISVTHKGVRAVGSPFRKRFKPGYIDAGKTVFLRPSPTILCISGEEISHEIQPRDKYGNDCDDSLCLKSNQNLEDKLKFIPRNADEVGTNNEITSDQLSYVFVRKQNSSRIELILVVHSPGIYKGQILYDGHPITSGQFDILSVTGQEHNEMLNIAKINPEWTAHTAILTGVGEELIKTNKVRKGYLYVSPKLLYVQEYILKIIPYKTATFRVSPMTKIKIIISTTISSADENKNEDYHFLIFDGIQPKITLQMQPSKARILLGLYCHFLRKRLGGSENFEGKQRVFYQELKSSQNDLRITSKQLKIARPNLVYSSMKETRYFGKSHWCKNFGIRFDGEQGYDLGGLRREWLELLCVQFFQNSEFGMFSSIGTSRLVHPTPSSIRYPLWNLKIYEFAGKIVGKCLFESACGGIYSQMVKARFTRSFLAQVLGLPPNFQHFEQDDPELYISKVKYILENDVADMDLTFSEEEYDSGGKLLKTAELIPNGSKTKVTIENKEQYLNALAQYRLGSRVIKEIESFKRGLHEIVPEELLTNFDEHELELLMCGRSEFDIEDLKENHVRDWGWGLNYNKLYEWFCTATASMSDDERARLLQFTTGSSLLPHGGFKALNPKFKLSISNEFGRLPTAHTCFNQICLSDHDTYEQFERALKVAINEGGEGFSFA